MVSPPTHVTPPSPITSTDVSHVTDPLATMIPDDDTVAGSLNTIERNISNNTVASLPAPGEDILGANVITPATIGGIQQVQRHVKRIRSATGSLSVTGDENSIIVDRLIPPGQHSYMDGEPTTTSTFLLNSATPMAQEGRFYYITAEPDANQEVHITLPSGVGVEDIIITAMCYGGSPFYCFAGYDPTGPSTLKVKFFAVSPTISSFADPIVVNAGAAFGARIMIQVFR
jgi:hypothetical protein